MVRFKNTFVLIPFFIFLLGSYLLALPYTVAFKKNSYEIMEQSSAYHFDLFKYVVDENDTRNAFTDEEKEQYNGENKQLIYENELTQMRLQIELKRVLPDETHSYEIGKEYIMKSVVPVLDNEGTIIDEDIYYIHLVMDIIDESKDEKLAYDIPERFDKLPNDEDDQFRHFLLVFYVDGFTYRGPKEVEGREASQYFNYRKISFDLSKGTDATYLSHFVIDMLTPYVETNYSFYSFIYIVILPFIITLLAWLIVRKGGALSTLKHFYNIGGIVSIPIILIFFVITWIPSLTRTGIMPYFPAAFLFYYLICIWLMNRRDSIE